MNIHIYIYIYMCVNIHSYLHPPLKPVLRRRRQPEASGAVNLSSMAEGADMVILGTRNNGFDISLQVDLETSNMRVSKNRRR